MDLADLATFTAVARRGSFAAAARERDSAPSTVSRAIAALEADLGARLFQRTTRRMRLTEAGELFLARVEAANDELDAARAEVSAATRDPAGTLRLTASVGFCQTCIVPLLPEFRTRFPNLMVELLETDANLDLIAERIDLAVRLAPRVEGNLVCAKLFDTRYRVCASPAYLQRCGMIAVPPELSAHGCLCFALPGFRTRWMFRDKQGKQSAVAVSGTVTGSSLTLRDCAVAGLGPSLLADWLIAAELKAGRLVDVFPEYEVTATEFDTAAWMIYPSRSLLPIKTRVAIDFFREHTRRS